jgi:uncharacterized Zn finger protein
VASVADLVEPEVLRERAGEYLQRAGEVLRQSAGVRLVEFGPTGVVAVVDDGTARTVRLQSVSGDLTIACDCGTPSWTGWCPHSVAAAIETWEQAPARRGSP